MFRKLKVVATFKPRLEAAGLGYTAVKQTATLAATLCPKPSIQKSLQKPTFLLKGTSTVTCPLRLASVQQLSKCKELFKDTHHCETKG